MWCRATAPTIPFPTSETASLFRVLQNVCYAPGQHAAVLGGCCFSFVKNRAYQPSYLFFFRSARTTLEKPEGPVDQKLYVISFSFARPQVPNRTPRRAGGGLVHGAPLNWQSTSRFISITRLSFRWEQFQSFDTPEKRDLRSDRVMPDGSSG